MAWKAGDQEGVQELPFDRTQYTRHDGKLKEQEQASFCAAGFFLWRPGEREAEVLMLWEDRKGRRLLNFPGGNRDSAEEGSLHVAKRETIEETANLLSPETISAACDSAMASNSLPVIWIPHSKYALHVLELPADCTDGDIVTQFASLPRREAGGPLALMTRGGDPCVVGLAWVRAAHVLENSPANFHPFTREMIRNLKDARILPCFS